MEWEKVIQRKGEGQGTSMKMLQLGPPLHARLSTIQLLTVEQWSTKSKKQTNTCLVAPENWILIVAAALTQPLKASLEQSAVPRGFSDLTTQV